MKKLLTLIILISLVFTMNVAGQNYIYSDDKQFPATNSWSFKLNATYWSGDPEIRVAKNSSGGYLMISIEVPRKEHYISGSVTVFLADGTAIKCTDKGIRDHVDNKSVALYNFSQAEIELLKSSLISKIRFSIMEGMDGTRAFTANNEKEYGSGDKKYHETNVEITAIFTE